MTELHPSRRGVLKAFGGTAAALALGGAGVVAAASSASAVGDGFGLQIIDSNESDPRLKYYRFKTAEIGWPTGPGVNVVVPADYATSGKRYPVLYLLHGGGEGNDFRWWDTFADIRTLSAGRDLIIVMPDGGYAGWYCNPVSSFIGPRNWESFHMNQLVPWIDANFRTHAEFAGRAVAGFSMGGFGALKYTAKYYGHFSSVSAYSGPADMRGYNGLLTHWANFSSMHDLAGGMVYGAPWAEARVSADNPMENIERYRGKRIFLSAGDSTQVTVTLPFFNEITEAKVLQSQKDFGAKLDQAGIPYELKPMIGEGHAIHTWIVAADIEAIVAHLRPAE
ncbi:alpha/beta hydrolase [Yinghuangia seranimata]|uniref:alpha/beta hydrolase n=1 Tax=Yinghuangia seranimata TaxID=408067 RepID=UPI00248BC7F1|nr:alpha/beta hydrolase family protein [Yinghuangia seranimata]MDI2124821.1 alpha/beta hydrolase family protein [Yinghuangia seranimata]